ncbi:MAG: TonB-dependent receptor [Capnocytophaga sp.]|nr:TonB-dependent receptor [Capnocytophaga sp.]
MKTFIFSLFVFSFCNIFAQKATIKGKITSDGKPVPYVDILAQKGKQKTGVVSSQSGDYVLEILSGEYTIKVSSLGMKTITEKISLKENEKITKNYQMEEDLLGLDQVVITGTRNIVPQFEAPVVVNKITTRVYEATQSLSLAEGLNFTPGLRTETNCQNCGFNQLRINGLQGPYSQILINGRAVFSSLTGIYGLEMIPVNMIDRIEVVKGGGSALYGGNAIGGTVNVLTKDPLDNSFSVGNNLSLYEGKTPDNTLIVNGSIVSEELDKGMTIFAYQRNRAPYDANDDEYSEITKLKNTTFGMDMFWKTSNRSKLKLNLNSINEFRRGGNKFDLTPHEADITEQLEHKIFGGDISYEHFSSDFKHKFSAYVSSQYTNRWSYYGGGLGKVVNPNDFNHLSNDDKETFLNALTYYGNANGLVGVGGVQYNYNINDNWNLALGTEYKYDKVTDKYIQKNQLIEQIVKTYGNYAQIEWKPVEKLTFLAGSRYDYIDIKGDYTFTGKYEPSNKTLSKFVPRFTTMFDITNQLKFRGSYAQGYRAPQAFDEDLHTSIVEAEPIYVELSKDLKPEHSNSYTASLNFTKKEGNTQANIILEGFFTRIKDALRNEDGIEQNGVFYKKKVNATDNLEVMGVNAEVNLAFGSNIIWQTGFTMQKSQYSEKQNIWTDENNDKNVLESKEVMKTPDLYGFTTFTYSPLTQLKLSYTGVFTGKMYVPHLESKTIAPTIKKSPIFYDQSIKIAYTFSLQNDYKLELSTGVQNIFNDYQKDFDKGKNRDADYIYGPQRPRTFFVGLTFKLN